MVYVDIDGTICDTVGSDYMNSTPIKENIDKINKLFDEGHTIIYWTARGGRSGVDYTEITRKQLTEWKCRYHHVKLDKASYDMIIDDKAINISDL